MTSPVIDQGRRGLRSWQAGLALALLGAALLVVGLVQTTSSAQARGCPDGTTLIAKFNFQGGTYAFEKGSGGSVSISNGTATGGTMQSSVPISAIIVKGGNDSVLITLDPPQMSASFSNAHLPTVGSGNIPDISNVQFCGPTTPPPTTTIAPTTTVAETTTIAPTTTVADTTTIAPTTTSTTEPEPTTTTSTTEPEPTTTTSTTEPEPTTTTSTTEPEPTTTTSTTEPEPTTTSTTEPEPTSSTSTSTAPSSTSTIEPTSTSTSTTAVGNLPPSPTTSTSTVPVIGPPSTPPGGVVTSVAVLPPADNPSLPVTGTRSMPLIVLGLLALGAGVTLIVVSRARERRLSD